MDYWPIDYWPVDYPSMAYKSNRKNDSIEQGRRANSIVVANVPATA